LLISPIASSKRRADLWRAWRTRGLSAMCILYALYISNTYTCLTLNPDQVQGGYVRLARGIASRLFSLRFHGNILKSSTQVEGPGPSAAGRAAGGGSPHAWSPNVTSRVPHRRRGCNRPVTHPQLRFAISRRRRGRDILQGSLGWASRAPLVAIGEIATVERVARGGDEAASSLKVQIRRPRTGRKTGPVVSGCGALDLRPAILIRLRSLAVAASRWRGLIVGRARLA